MRLDDLREIKNRRPFEPFDIHLSDGRELTVLSSRRTGMGGPGLCAV